MSLMIIKRDSPEAFRGVVSKEVTNAKRFLGEIEKRFSKSDKAEISILLHRLTSMRYNGKGNIREYIMDMSHIVSKLKTLMIQLSEDILLHLVLNSLSAYFNQFKLGCNCHKEKWYLKEPISFCVQEEERLKQDKIESAHLASTSKDKGKKRKRNTDKNEAAKSLAQNKQKKDENNCFFCKKSRHVKKECTKNHAWRAKKGMFLNFICSENNLASIPRNTWWLDSYATSNINVSMQGCLIYRKPINAERYIYVGDGTSVEMEVIGHFRLLLCPGF